MVKNVHLLKTIKFFDIFKFLITLTKFWYFLLLNYENEIFSLFLESHLTTTFLSTLSAFQKIKMKRKKEIWSNLVHLITYIYLHHLEKHTPAPTSNLISVRYKSPRGVKKFQITFNWGQKQKQQQFEHVFSFVLIVFSVNKIGKFL